MSAIFWLSAFAYLVFGFVLGIYREWSYQWAYKPPTSDKSMRWLRIGSAIFNFPCTSFGIIDLIDVRNGGWALERSGGGFLYWNTMAIFWPLVIAWSVLCLIIIFLLGVIFFIFDMVVLILSFPGIVCRRCEQKIRSAFGIEADSAQ